MWRKFGYLAASLTIILATGCGGGPVDEEVLESQGAISADSFGAQKSDQSDEVGGEYDWTTDNIPEPEGKFENLAQSPSEAKRLSACYQKLVMNCYDVHEEVRVRESDKEVAGDMNMYMISAYFAAEKDFILACIANHVG